MWRSQSKHTTPPHKARSSSSMTLPVPQSISSLRGTTAEIVTRLTEHGELTELAARTRGDLLGSPVRSRGRPKLGVVAREVTLLPRHWEWLAEQKSGASQALRRLVDEARRADAGQTDRKAAAGAGLSFPACTGR